MSPNVLTITPERLDLGSFEPGQGGRGKLTLRNESAKPVLVAKIAASCDCIKFDAASVQVEPGSSANLGFRYDPADDPNFEGGLRIVVLGEDADRTTLFRAEVKLIVKDAGVGKPRVGRIGSTLSSTDSM